MNIYPLALFGGFLSGYIDDWLKAQSDSIVGFFSSLLVDISGIGLFMVELPVVDKMTAAAQVVAFSLLATKVAFEGWMNYALRMNGDPDSDLAGVIIRAAASAAMIGAAPALLKLIYTFSINLSDSIAKLDVVPEVVVIPLGERSIQVDGGVDDVLRQELVFQLVTQEIGGLQMSALLILVAVVFMGIFLLLVFVQTLIRGAEIAFAAIVGPIMALGITNESSGSWSGWVKEILALCFTSLAQLVMIKIAFTILLAGAQNPDGSQAVHLGYSAWANVAQSEIMSQPTMRIMMFFCVLWVAYKVPSTVKNFSHTTGISKAASGTATRMAAKVFSKLVK